MTAQPPPVRPPDANEPRRPPRPGRAVTGTTFVSDGPDLPARG